MYGGTTVVAAYAVAAPAFDSMGLGERAYKGRHRRDSFASPPCDDSAP